MTMRMLAKSPVVQHGWCHYGCCGWSERILHGRRKNPRVRKAMRAREKQLWPKEEACAW